MEGGGIPKGCWEGVKLALLDRQSAPEGPPYESNWCLTHVKFPKSVFLLVFDVIECVDLIVQAVVGLILKTLSEYQGKMIKITNHRDCLFQHVVNSKRSIPPMFRDFKVSE